ncbi:MAG: ammonium transporter [Candidatus Methanoplasma sp.]|jgi:ammonium transporter Rh|nr:ammonium transporter [Candidatus Methanoplasma sp.]
MQKFGKTMLALVAFAMVAVFSIITYVGAANAAPDYTTAGDATWENFKFVKNVMIWFMLMLVAFLMLFIKKFEWGVALAVLLSAAGSFIVYLALQDFVFDNYVWDQDVMLMGVICAITVVIAIGCFLGTVKMWQYLLVGILFAPVFCLVELFMAGEVVDSIVAADPGGSILVHMCAAYFGLGVAIGIREKRAFNEPMYTTTHSVSFVWLASMLLWVLWPSFVTALLPMEQVFWGMMTCYLAGMGSILSAWVVCMLAQKKVNPLIYTYAMLAGPVAIGAPLILVGPWAAIVVGLVAGAVSALSFVYLHPRLCKALGTVDVMGVHNLHGVGGWIGMIASVVAMGILDASLYGDAITSNIVSAVFVAVVTLVLGIVIGVVLKLTRGKMPDEDLFSDDVDFIKTEEPAS